MVRHIDIDEARRAWNRGQGLDGRADAGLAAVVARTGWLRTLGGIEAYLALEARVEGLRVAAVHEAVGAGELVVTPAARGCVYVVPREHAGLARRLAAGLSERRHARDLEKAGVSSEEIDAVCEAVVEALGAEARSTRGLRGAMPEGVVRSLGDDGKKVGMSSTLPPALRTLEFEGRIVRRPVEDRLDHERYVWALNEVEGEAALDDPAEVHRRMAELYFGWAGPATRKAFAAWTGLGQRDAKAAIAAAGLVEVSIEGLEEVWMRPDELEAVDTLMAHSQVNWLPGLDNLTALREDASLLVPEAQAELEVANFGRGGMAPLASVSQPLERLIAREGRIVGLWAWDPAEEVVVRYLFEGEEADEAGAARVAALIRELGHGEVYAIDGEEKLQARADRVRRLAGC